VPRQLLSSRTAAVRAEAVHALGEATTAKAALTDRTALVRATAQAVLRRTGHDPAESYRALVIANPAPPVIAGLGETGHAADADLIRPWLAHPLPRGRAEAVGALRRLGHLPVDLLLPLLTDEFAMVTRQVAIALRPRASTLDEQLLRDLLGHRHPRHVRFAAYRLLRDHHVWTRLAVDLELIDDTLSPLRNHARADLVSWLSWEAATTYTMPTGAEKDRLDRLVRRAEAALDSHRIRELRFHLGL
jgi:HEAT repeat protein